MNDHEQRRDDFHPLPYYRILILFWNELLPITEDGPEGKMYEPNLAGSAGILGPVTGALLKPYEPNFLVSIYNTLHILRPSKVPAFAFAWLDLLTHRTLLPRFLKYGSATPHTGSTPAGNLVCIIISAMRFY